MQKLPGILQFAAGILRRPVALVIAGLGVLCGIPLGRLLHDPPWRPEVKERTTLVSPGITGTESLTQFPAAPRKYDGLSPAEREAGRAVDELEAKFDEWKVRDGDSGQLLPMPLVMAALELGARSDVELVMKRLPVTGNGYRFTDLILCAWADRDPQSAWDYFLAAKLKGALRTQVPQFDRRMARHHWPLMAKVMHDPEKLRDNSAVEAWTQRIMDASADPAAVRRLALEAPKGRLREIALERAMWILAPAHPQEAIALVAVTQDTDRFHNRGTLAKHLARSHPELALDLLDQYPLDQQFDWVSDDDSSAFDVMTMTIRRDTAGTLMALANFASEGRFTGNSYFTSSLAEQLPRRMEDWVPAAVSAAGPGESGAEFLAAMCSDCPWNNGAAGVPAIAAIQNTELQAAAAGAWATRWAAVEFDAARAWAETLPPAARARALTGLWREDTPPDAALASCAAAGTIPDANTLAVMSDSAPEVTAAWIAAQPDANAWHMGTVARTWAGTDPAAAASWAAQLPDAELRVRIVTAVMEAWLSREPEAAVNWLATSPLDDEDRTFVQDLTGL